MKQLSYLKGDRVIWAIVFLLSLLSILVVYSSVVTLAHKYKQGNTEAYLIKHGITVVGGIIIMYLVHKMKYTLFSRVAQIGILLVVPLLLFTLLRGVSAGEASRWIPIPGIGLTFQSSDVAKIILLIFVARTLICYKISASSYRFYLFINFPSKLFYSSFIIFKLLILNVCWKS